MDLPKFGIPRVLLFLPLLLSVSGLAHAQLTLSPELITPENGAEGLPTTVPFEWEQVLLTDTYHFQLAVDEDFDELIADLDDLSDTTASLDDLDFETTYFWRVRGINVSGPGDWSETWSFTTEEEPVDSIPPPEALNPENGEEDIRADTVRIEWTRIDEAASTYDFQLATDTEHHRVIFWIIILLLSGIYPTLCY